MLHSQAQRGRWKERQYGSRSETERENQEDQRETEIDKRDRGRDTQGRQQTSRLRWTESGWARETITRNHTEETQAALDALHLEITASWETVGPLYKGMYGLEHTLTIMQYKADNHMLNLMTIAHQAEEAISLANYVAAEQAGSWAYAMKTVKAFFANPIGGVL